MLRVAVCDDEEAYLTEMNSLLCDYGKQQGSDIRVSVFAHPLELTDACKKGTLFQIFLLDVYMPGMDGIALARELRGQGNNAPIIFFTTSTDHALEAFGVGATQYLVKPFARSALYAAMDAAVEKARLEQRHQIVLKTGGAYQTVDVRDILYSETRGNYQYLLLTDGNRLTVRMTTGELYARLAPSGSFIRCGASYILNLIHAKRLYPKSILMSDQTEIPIPRGAYPDIKGSYFAFYSRRG